MSERDADPPLGKGAKAAVILVAAAIVGGAGYMMFQKTPDDVVEEHRGAASAKIEAVRARMDAARSLAPLTEDTLQAPAERVDIGQQGNGALVHVIRLEEPPPGTGTSASSGLCRIYARPAAVSDASRGAHPFRRSTDSVNDLPIS